MGIYWMPPAQSKMATERSLCTCTVYLKYPISLTFCSIETNVKKEIHFEKLTNINIMNYK